MDLAFGRYINDNVALDLRLTPQTPPCGQPAFVIIPLFNCVPFGKRAFGHGDPVFGEFAIGWRYLALAANTAAPTDAIEIDTQLPRSR